jgi:ABC-type dipeptide/oligopeptide/nickel transport system permease subunit
MVTVMPAADMGLFGLEIDFMVPLVIALFHLLYGVLLGAIYGKLVDTDEARERDIHHAQH